MAGNRGRYIEVSVKDAATITADETTDPIRGFGDMSQVFGRLEVTGATGTTPTLDVKVQTRLAGTWVDLLTFTQVTGATTETKYAIRTATVAWSDELRVDFNGGADADEEYTGVDFILYGAVA